MPHSIHPAIQAALAKIPSEPRHCCGSNPPCQRCVRHAPTQTSDEPTSDTMTHAPPTAIEDLEGRPTQGPRRAPRGLSLVEVLVSLAITAALLTATMVAIDASFKAYAAAAESASTQTATRLTVHKLLGMVRNATVHGPLSTSDDIDANFVGNKATSDYITLLEPDGDLITLSYDAGTKQLMMTLVPDGASVGTTQPVLGGVTDASFVIRRKRLPSGIWVLSRASIDLTVEPDPDNTLALEASDTPPVRFIASTKPRRIR